jgi:hypothetical protein
MCHGTLSFLIGRLGLYGVYLYGCVRLTVALFATISFPALIFKDDDLFALALFDDMAFDNGTFNDRLADLHILTVREHQYLIKSNLSSKVAGQLFNAQNVTLLNLILLASSGYDSIHVCFLQTCSDFEKTE